MFINRRKSKQTVSVSVMEHEAAVLKWDRATPHWPGKYSVSRCWVNATILKTMLKYMLVFVLIINIRTCIFCMVVTLVMHKNNIWRHTDQRKYSQLRGNLERRGEGEKKVDSCRNIKILWLSNYRTKQSHVLIKDDVLIPLLGVYPEELKTRI